MFKINNAVWKTVHRFIGRRLLFSAWVALAVFAAGQWLPHWFAELFSHFVPYYAAIWLLAAVWCSGKVRWLWAVAALGSLLWLAQPWSDTPSVTKPDMTLLWYNVNLDNPAAAQEAARIIDSGADVAALAEIDWNDLGWQALRRAYPYGCGHRDDSPFALSLLSKSPPTECVVQMVAYDGAEFPYIRAQIGNTAVFALHPPPPVGHTLAAARTHYLEQTAAAMAQETRVIAIGDLNSSPFSPLFRRWTAQARVQSAQPNWLPTWKPFGLNIDHALSRGGYIQVQAQPWLASDHRPLLVRWQSE